VEKHEWKIRKIKKFGKRLSNYIFSFIISYLLSLFSFYVYTQLSQILLTEKKDFPGFIIIGLTAGLISVLVSFVSSQYILTVVISFIIYCLIDSFSLFFQLGVRVAQFLPGLLIGMSAIIASWNLLKIKLRLSTKINITLPFAKEHLIREHTFAQKLIENPNKLTLSTFKKACGLLQGIDPKVDAVLKKAIFISRTLNFLRGNDLIGFAVSNIKVKTQENEERKKKLLLFIDLVNDIREEVGIALVRFDTARGQEHTNYQIKQVDHSTVANMMTNTSGISATITAGIATVMASSIIAANATGMFPNISFLQNNKLQGIQTQNSQENSSTQANAPSAFLTDIPKTVPILTYSTVEKTIFVSALEEGTTYIAGSAGTYRFTITGGAYMADPAKGWEAKVMIYKNRSVDWSGPNETHTNWDYLVGYPDFKPTREEAELMGKGKYIDISLNKDEYLIFIVFDSKGDFVDNSGGMYVQVQKAIISTPTSPPISAIPTINVDNGWGHFTRIFSGPPGPDTTSTLDMTTIATYMLIRNNSKTSDSIIGAVSQFCKYFTMQDMSPDSSSAEESNININIPAQSTVELKFMGQRLICKGASGVKLGDRIPVGINFEKSGQIPVLVEIRVTPE
jgi:copper(I)-binding protein